MSSAAFRVAVTLGCLIVQASPGVATLVTTAQFSGHFNVQVHAFGQACGSSISGVNVSPVIGPAGATVSSAFLLTGDFLGINSGGGALAASLGIQSLGTFSPFTQDPALNPTSFAYIWNANPPVNQSGTFAVSVAAGLGQIPANQLCGAALVVVTQHSSFQLRTITINTGTLTIGDNSPAEMVSTSFSELIPNAIGSGVGQLLLFTLADDAFNTGEQLAFNGQPLIAPGAFDGNLGVNASLVVQPVNVNAGPNNSADITTNGDFFSWNMAILNSPIPEPATGSLVLILALATAASRRARLSRRPDQGRA